MTSKESKPNQSVTLEVPEELIRSADFVGELVSQDRCAMLLRWLQAGAEREMLQLVSDGELSTGKFVELLGVTYWDYHPMREKYRVRLDSDEHLVEKHAAKLADVLKASRKNPKE